MTAAGIIWSILLDPIIGLIPHWVREIGIGNFQFLHDPGMAMPLVVFVTIWKTFGLNMLIFVAGLLSLPKDYYEAADLDGATKFQQFKSITLPLISSTLGFCVITGIIGAFMVFDQTYIMTGGGPLFRTETMAQYIYTRGFNSPFRLGYASALAQGLFIIIAVITLIMYKYFIKNEGEQG